LDSFGALNAGLLVLVADQWPVRSVTGICDRRAANWI